MQPWKSTWGIVATWALVLGTYAVVSFTVPRGRGLSVFGDVVQCLVPLVANAGLLLNAVSPYRRRNAFWMLWAMGCTIWLFGQLVWTYYELVLGQSVPNPLVGDFIFFLHIVPMIAALAARPHLRRVGKSLRYSGLDTLLLALWWIYIFLFLVIPSAVFEANPERYGQRFVEVYSAESLVLLVGLGILCIQTSGAWRRIYLHLFGASILYTLASELIAGAMWWNLYYTGSIYDLPLVASFLWYGTAGLVAYRLSPVPEPARNRKRGDSRWPERLAMLGVLSMPVFVAWNNFLSPATPQVQQFRLLWTLAVILAGTALVFLRQHRVDEERLRLVRASQESLDNLKRLQMQCVQAEKLASLGQLAAGAAHEINNPLTAILGYSDLLFDDAEASEATRSIAEKIRAQARRTRSLVNNLLSFARQVPAEKTLLDLNTVLVSAVELRTLDLRDKNIQVEMQTEPALPAVRGDPNQLLQVFFQIVSNAVDAMQETGGGALTIHTLRDGVNVAIEFDDTGPGIRDPQMVFDPFYTTKPVGKGSGLGLSICYGIVKEHGGHISCHNRSEGGATFRVELPAVLAPFPQKLMSIPATPAVKAQ